MMINIQILISKQFLCCKVSHFDSDKNLIKSHPHLLYTREHVEKCLQWQNTNTIGGRAL